MVWTLTKKNKDETKTSFGRRVTDVCEVVRSGVKANVCPTCCRAPCTRTFWGLDEREDKYK